MTDSKDTTGSASPAPAARTFLSPFRDDLDAVFDRFARGLTPFPLQDFGSWLGRGRPQSRRRTSSRRSRATKSASICPASTKRT